MNNDPAIANLESLAFRRFSNWTGLSPGSTLEQAARVFDVDQDWHGSGRLGQQRRSVDWYGATGDGYPDGIRLWVENKNIVLADAKYPELTESLDAVLSSLGPPQKKLDAYLGTVLIEESEWVFSERGLSIFLDPENQELLRIAVYSPVALTTYEASLRLNLKQVRLPRTARSVNTERL